MLKILLICFFHFNILIFSCSVKDKGFEISNTVQTEDFEAFITKFKLDREFRQNRIRYPLSGFNSDENTENEGDSLVSSYKWTPEMINYYLDFDYSDKKYVYHLDHSVGIVKESIIIEGSGFRIESEYRLINNRWFLSYYFYQNE